MFCHSASSFLSTIRSLACLNTAALTPPKVPRAPPAAAPSKNAWPLRNLASAPSISKVGLLSWACDIINSSCKSSVEPSTKELARATLPTSLASCKVESFSYFFK